MSYICFVISKDGNPLMPSSNPKKIRKLLKTKQAKIYKRNPFTIQLLYSVDSNNQSVEIGMDTGYLHIGVSVKSEKHEYWSGDYKLLPDEKIHHQDQLIYRRSRRSRLRYRRAKFKTRKDSDRLTNKKEGWLAPSLKNKADRHVDLIKTFCEICPVSKVTLEMGQFDTNALQCYEAGMPLPEGKDYQKGMRYGYDTLRDAVLQRDNYTCQLCGRGIKNNVILCIHHIGFYNRDRSNRATNLITLCTHCHTGKNHQKGGKLWNWKPRAKPINSAAFMNTVRYYIYNRLKTDCPDLELHMTYGTVTKRKRIDRCILKTHANDAYCIGTFIPLHRSQTRYFEKRRRNDRKLVIRFTDAKYIDTRDGKKKPGAVLSCGRTKRSEPRNGKNNLRKFRGRKVSKGTVGRRYRKFEAGPGDLYEYQGVVYEVKGNAAGKRIRKGIEYDEPSRDRLVFKLPDKKTKSAKLIDCKLVRKLSGGWKQINR